MTKSTQRVTTRVSLSVINTLQLSYIASSFTDLAMRAAREGLTHEAFLYELAQQEYAYRQQRRLERLLRASHTPRTFEHQPGSRSRGGAGASGVTSPAGGEPKFDPQVADDMADLGTDFMDD